MVRSAHRSRGLTLLELVVTVAIVVLLMGILIPVSKDLIDSSRASQILATAEALRDACQRFWHDTDRFAVEDTGTPEALLLDPANHQLSMEPDPAAPIAGWKGPYLNEPLRTSQNPYSDRVQVANDLGDGFDLLGNGAVIVGSGNFVLFYGVKEAVAAKVDAELDPDAAAAGKDWKEIGRVEYRAPLEILVIYLLRDVS